jgi:hypothetical protein
VVESASAATVRIHMDEIGYCRTAPERGRRRGQLTGLDKLDHRKIPRPPENLHA